MFARMVASLMLLHLLASGAVSEPDKSVFSSSLSPIQKVVKLITEMKAQTVKEGEEDQTAYDKYKCWCLTTESEKTDAVKAAEAKIEELTSFIAEAAAKEGELKTEIAGLEEDIAADKEALATATEMREKENAEFKAEEADMKETLSLLSEAITVLSKVQLLQKPGEKEAAMKTALLQVNGIIRRASPQFQMVMQKDLYDMLGEFHGVEQKDMKLNSKDVVSGSFLAAVFAPKRDSSAALEQASRSLPWIKTEEQLGKEADPNSLDGNAAGVKSYNSRSGSILGILKTQGDKFAKLLAASQKAELQALVDFQKLQAAKTGEIASATQSKDDKSAELADLLDKVAKAKEDLEATQAALSADQKFLVEMTKNCATEDEEYAKRVKVRSEEVKALSETLNILTGDQARTLFDKTISFLQISSISNIAAAQEQARTKAMQRILEVSRKHKNWMLATLAVHVKLDAFTKVKEVMDKMLSELKSQQKAEYAKWDSCKADIDATEDKIWTGNNEKNDLAAKHEDEVNTLKVLAVGIEELKKEVAEMEVSLKDAGEQRKAENERFQTEISDQRATIAILHMAKDRLKEFYAPKASMVQVHLHAQSDLKKHAVEPPPPKPKDYEKSASSGGVLQLLDMIIEDAGRTEAELQVSEQKAQEEYAAYAAATTESIETDREAISEKEKQSATSEGEKSETEEAQLANQLSLDKLGELLHSVHLDCDFLIKYFDIRQKSRAEEMDAIEEAKAILSGADFS
jgi:chromosome segregation ATPase